MSKQLFNGIAYIANAIATAAAHVASGYPDSPCCAPTPEPQTTGTPEPEAPKKPGRPKKEAAAPTPPAEPEKATTPEPEPEVEKPSGMTLEQLRAVVEPLVKDQRGNEVKKEIQKFGVATLAELVGLPQHHPEFVKNIEALTI